MVFIKVHDYACISCPEIILFHNRLPINPVIAAFRLQLIILYFSPHVARPENVHHWFQIFEYSFDDNI